MTGVRSTYSIQLPIGRATAGRLGIRRPRLIGWLVDGEAFLPSRGTRRDVELMRQACELMGRPMPEPVYGWRRA